MSSNPSGIIVPGIVDVSSQGFGDGILIDQSVEVRTASNGAAGITEGGATPGLPSPAVDQDVKTGPSSNAGDFSGSSVQILRESGTIIDGTVKVGPASSV
jgi:hypothetical protein